MVTRAWVPGGLTKTRAMCLEPEPKSWSHSGTGCDAVRAVPHPSHFSVLKARNWKLEATSVEVGSLGDCTASDLKSLALVLRGAARTCSPEQALRGGHWVKLICGASFEDVVEVRNLSLVYTLAGVDCIDCAADPAVVNAVLEGVRAAANVALRFGGSPVPKPWIMVSINDDEDPHFRKAEFDPKLCPADCPRPCERVCPVSAIDFTQQAGVKSERCYGCGRCLPVCPLGLIRAKTYIRGLETVGVLLRSSVVDAVEIHTGEGHLEAFENLWTRLGECTQQLKLVAVSVPDLGLSMVPTLVDLYAIMKPSLRSFNLWQLDGRPMSGDIGAGATRAAVALAARLVASSNRPPGFLQLAGGTNAHTLEAMRKAGLLVKNNHGEAAIAGVAYGGYARKIVRNYLMEVEESQQKRHGGHASSQGVSLGLETCPSLLLKALEAAIALVQESRSFEVV